MCQECQEKIAKLTKLLADLSEDYAIEILADATKEDFEALGETAQRLVEVSSVLSELKHHVPFAVMEVVRHLREMRPVQ